MAFIQHYLLQDAQTATGNGTLLNPVGSSVDICITLTGNGTVSGGNIIIEESDDRSYTGLWSQLDTLPASTYSGNVKQCKHYRVGAGNWTRARISSTITGGGTITITGTGY